MFVFITRPKFRVEEDNTDSCLHHSTSQYVPLWNDSRAPQLWSPTVFTLTEQVLRFALNSLTDTLPHDANLHLRVSSVGRGKLSTRRYNDNHDAILAGQFSPSPSITVDLPNQPTSSRSMFPAPTVGWTSLFGTCQPSLSSS